MRKINFRKGNASGYIGLSLVLLSYIGLICIVALFSAFFTQTKVQMLTDVVMDGATVAGNLPSGFNKDIMESKAYEILEKNEIENIVIEDIKVEAEQDGNGTPTGSTIVSGTLSADIEMYAPIYLDYDARFKTTASAVIRIDPITNEEGLLSENFIHCEGALPPFATTSPGHRNSAYVTWIMNYYLNPENNLLYRSGVNEFFIYDYLMCMGFSEEEMRVGSSDSLKQTLKKFLTGEEWTKTTEYEEIISAANAGKPVLIVNTENYLMSVVMPVQGIKGEHEIPTAFVGEERWNYKNISIESLINSEKVFAVIHE